MTQGQLGDPERTKIYLDNSSSHCGKFDTLDLYILLNLFKKKKHYTGGPGGPRGPGDP